MGSDGDAGLIKAGIGNRASCEARAYLSGGIAPEKLADAYIRRHGLDYNAGPEKIEKIG